MHPPKCSHKIAHFGDGGPTIPSRSRPPCCTNQMDQLEGCTAKCSNTGPHTPPHQPKAPDNHPNTNGVSWTPAPKAACTKPSVKMTLGRKTMQTVWTNNELSRFQNLSVLFHIDDSARYHECASCENIRICAVTGQIHIFSMHTRTTTDKDWQCTDHDKNRWPDHWKKYEFALSPAKFVCFPFKRGRMKSGRDNMNIDATDNNKYNVATTNMMPQKGIRCCNVIQWQWTTMQQHHELTQRWVHLLWHGERDVSVMRWQRQQSPPAEQHHRILASCWPYGIESHVHQTVVTMLQWIAFFGSIGVGSTHHGRWEETGAIVCTRQSPKCVCCELHALNFMRSIHHTPKWSQIMKRGSVCCFMENPKQISMKMQKEQSRTYGTQNMYTIPISMVRVRA